MLNERDVQIAFMLHRLACSKCECYCRCSFLDEAASYAPLLDQLSNTLKTAFTSVAPKASAQQAGHVQQQQSHHNHQTQSARPLVNGTA